MVYKNLRSVAGFLIHLQGFLHYTYHQKICVGISKVDTKLCYTLKVSLLLFIKILSNQLFGNSSFAINQLRINK